jgi:anti-sigma regulatory factor (Ser/Thr protein kinase)
MLVQSMQPSATQQALGRDFLFTGDVDTMPAARDVVMHFIDEHCVDQDDEIDILIALQEALANAVLHGCGNDPGKTIHCTVNVEPSAITILVQDPGPGFDTSQVLGVGDAQFNLSEHGRGISLMRSLMDEVHYMHNGSQVELKKQLSHPIK